LRGTLVGICMLATAAGSVLSGWMGGLYESLGPAPFWLINAAICTGAGFAILLGAPLLNRLLAQDEAPYPE
jgi:POT family proton-dependent oligopeptide transporter